MAYELRQNGTVTGRFDTEEAAVAAAAELIRADADANVEVLDTATGQPAAPGASTASREELAKRVGF